MPRIKNYDINIDPKKITVQSPTEELPTRLQLSLHDGKGEWPSDEPRYGVAIFNMLDPESWDGIHSVVDTDDLKTAERMYEETRAQLERGNYRITVIGEDTRIDLR